jgi:hypothetical protein
LSDFEEKKKLNLLLFFLSLGQIVLWETQTYPLVFSIVPNRKIFFDIQFFVWESINAWFFLGRI